jgi:Probable zinc-ribbon domain
MKSPPAEYADFVEHPRYGKGPRRTGLDVDVDFTPDGKVFCHWHSPPGVRIPKTAIAAHVPSQAPATVPVTHYYDARRVCRKCGKPFLFFAEEQKYWYETLKFPLEADCLECVTCRKDEQHLRAARQRYDALLAATSRSEADTLTLVSCAVLLVESSVFSGKVLPKLRGLLKPLLADPAGPFFVQARALLSRIESITER